MLTRAPHAPTTNLIEGMCSQVDEAKSNESLVVLNAVRLEKVNKVITKRNLSLMLLLLRNIASRKWKQLSFDAVPA
jgi:hypothetical protein